MTRDARTHTHTRALAREGDMASTLVRGLAAGEALAGRPDDEPLPGDLEAHVVALLDRVATLRHQHGKFAEVGKDLAQTRVLVEVYAGKDLRALAREYSDACRELMPRALDPGDPFKLGKGLARPNCLAYLTVAIKGWVRGESSGYGNGYRDRGPVWARGPEMPDAPAILRELAE